MSNHILLWLLEMELGQVAVLTWCWWYLEINRLAARTELRYLHPFPHCLQQPKRPQHASHHLLTFDGKPFFLSLFSYFIHGPIYLSWKRPRKQVLETTVCLINCGTQDQHCLFSGHTSCETCHRWVCVWSWEELKFPQLSSQCYKACRILTP